MKYRSAFDIIGPVMIGPSSSHTAGAARNWKGSQDLVWQTTKESNHFIIWFICKNL